MATRWEIARRMRRLRPGWAAVHPAGIGIPTPPEPIPGDGNIWIPMGLLASVEMVGRDPAEVIRAIEGQTFLSSNTGVFTVSSSRANPSVAVITPVGVGSAALQLAADADPGNPFVPLVGEIMVNVFRKATALWLFYVESGSTEELRAPIVAGSVVFDVPAGRTFTVRVEGRDDKGIIVPLSNVFFDNGGSLKYHWTPTNPVDPYRAILTPDTIGGSGFIITADGDPSPGSSPLSISGGVNLLDDPLADHLTATVTYGPTTS